MVKAPRSFETFWGRLWNCLRPESQLISSGLPRKLPLTKPQQGKPSHIFWDIENLKLPADIKKHGPRFISHLRVFFSASRIITAVENPLVEPATSHFLSVASSHCNVEVLSYIRPQLINSSLRQTADYQLKQVPTHCTIVLLFTLLKGYKYCENFCRPFLGL